MFWSISGSAQSYSGQAEVEYRYFPETAVDSRRSNNNFSASLAPELYKDFSSTQRVVFAPFFRYDNQDPERTHGDIRELYWRASGKQFEWRVGVRQVFWGVAEARHLVDVINQTDLVEDLDGEDKLGQPMINLAWIQSFGTVDLFVLPYFRERTFAGIRGRPRGLATIDSKQARYQSGAKQYHVDVAVRYSHSIDSWDIGVSHFHGTAREPRLTLGTGAGGQPVLIPNYDQIDQTGIDVQTTRGAWLWKLEAIFRSRGGAHRSAGIGGFEYTFGNVLGAADIGMLAEYSFDAGDQSDTSPFKTTVFGGVRVAFSDVNSTSLLAGVVTGADDGSRILQVEAERRIGQYWTAHFNLRAFSKLHPGHPLYGIRRDDYAELRAAYHF
jgi:hypothetical protein